MKLRALLATFVIAFASGIATAQDPIFSPSDFILAIDEDVSPDSNYPLGEEPFWIADADPMTKYLNFGGVNSGFIVTPAGPTTVQSMYFTSANDAPERDPRDWQLFGTNDAIQSLDNSDAMGGETWNLIASGVSGLTPMRGQDGPVQSFVNGTSYTSYLMTFPNLRNNATANSMQFADLYMFESNDGSGSTILDFYDDYLGIDTDGDVSESAYPGAESPQDGIDGNVATKYLNFGEENSGFIITPAAGPSVVDSFQFTTANDFESRDPFSYELYGTNDAIVSTDNSVGDAESWTLISSGPLTLPLDRNTPDDIEMITNTTEYRSYKMVFPTVRDPEGDMADSMQFSEIQFFGTINNVVDGDFNDDGNWDGLDIDALVAEIAAGGTDLSFDMNGDGVIDRNDITDAGNGWLAVGGANNPGATGGNPFLLGDATLDGAVDGQDFIEWNNNKFTNLAAWTAGDFNADGAVDGQDFIEWNNFKFMSSDVQSVPEPATGLLALLTCGLVAAWRRRN